jgi:dTDP-4-dehydrorhamnose reductase
VAKACKRAGVPLVAFSSDMVFDGIKQGPYLEHDAPNPVNAYGRSKAEMERRLFASGADVLVVRSATFFSGHEAHNFAMRHLDELARKGVTSAADDLLMSPTYVPDLVDAVLDLLLDGERGIWHLSNPAAVSWADFVKSLAQAAGFDPMNVEAAPAVELGWTAPRPRAVPLASTRGAMLSEVEPAISRFLNDTRIGHPRQASHSPAAERDPKVMIAVA